MVDLTAPEVIEISNPGKEPPNKNLEKNKTAINPEEVISTTDPQSVEKYPESPKSTNEESEVNLVTQNNKNNVSIDSVSSKFSNNSILSEKNDELNISSHSSQSFHDSFLQQFPGQLPNTPKEVPADTSKLSDELLSDRDDSPRSSQASSNFSHSFQERENYLIETIRSLAKKLQDENQEKTNLKNIIDGQEKEIISLQRENLKFELELDEAGTLIANTDLELKNTKAKLKFTEELLTESKKNIPMNPNEIYSHTPHEVYELYKKELNLSNTKTSQIKTLLGELKVYKKNISELKKESDDLRLKVVNLKEEDIDKKILNYTIEENRKLEYKIKIQK